MARYSFSIKVCYDQGSNDIGVVIVTKWRYHLFYLQQYFSSLRIILFFFLFSLSQSNVKHAFISKYFWRHFTLKDLCRRCEDVPWTHIIYFIQALENTGKRRIQFLIHKSWRTEKVIGKKSQSVLLALLSFLFGRGPNRAIETVCFDANVQYANVLYKVRGMWERKLC